MNQVFKRGKQFVKFCIRHWKFIVGTATSCCGMYLIAKGEYETGLKDMGEMQSEGFRNCMDLTKEDPQELYDEKYTEGINRRWKEMYE